MSKCNIVPVESIIVTASEVVLNLPNASACNNKCVRFYIPMDMPVVAPLPVMIGVGVMGYRMINKCGNYVYSDQLRNRRVYVVELKTDSLLAINKRKNLLCTDAIIPCYPVAPTPTPPIDQNP